MSVTSTPTTRVRSPASASPATSPACVPPVPTATYSSAGSGSRPARTCSASSRPAETNPSWPLSEEPPGGTSSGRSPRSVATASVRSTCAAVPGRLRPQRCCAPQAAWSRSERCTSAVTGCITSTRVVFEARLAREDGGGEAVVRAEPAGRDEVARAVRQRRAQDPLELARLVPSIERRAALVALHEEHAFRETGQGQRRDRRRARHDRVVREPGAQLGVAAKESRLLGLHASSSHGRRAAQCAQRD